VPPHTKDPLSLRIGFILIYDGQTRASVFIIFSPSSPYGRKQWFKKEK
jgi:hypothetical protein